jgi:hypothetical protein
MVDIASVAVAVTTALAPFAPYLIDAGKAAADKLAETIGSHGGEAAWKTAQTLWTKITGRFQSDDEINDATTALATRPDSNLFRKTMSEILAQRLTQDAALASELVALLGGEHAVQRVIAGHDAQIKDIQQKMTGAGEQVVQGGDKAVIQGVRQEQQGN